MSFERRGTSALLAAGCVALALVACGKKGDPQPPLLPIPHAADDLTVQQRGSELILRFGYPRTTAAGMPLGELERIEVHELVRPALERPAEAPEAAEPEAPEAMAPEVGAPEAAEPAEESAPEAETAATGTPAAPAAGEGPAPPSLWLAPPIDAREFGGAATVVLTLRDGELADAVRGDRLVLTLPLGPAADPPQARYYAVRSVAEGDFESALSNRVGLVAQSPPPAPGDLTAHARADGIEIGWQAEQDDRVTGFNVYRRLATERDFGEPLQLVGPAQRSFTDLGARYGQRYLYAVTAVAQRVPLVESAIAAAREVDYRDLFPPPVPTSMVALADAGAVRVVWDKSRSPDLAGYHVYRRRGAGEWRRLTAQPTGEVEYVDRDVAPGEPYAYRVTAVDELGNESEPSAVAETRVR